MRLNIDREAWHEMSTVLRSRSDVESAAIIIAEPIGHDGSGVVCARLVIPWPEEAYRERRVDRIVLDPVHLTRVLQPARERQWAVFTVHTHPQCDEAWFSAADDAGDARLMAALRCQIPSTRHGSIVIARSGAFCGRWFDDAGQSSRLEIVASGHRLERLTQDGVVDGMERDHRQILALGPTGHAQLRRSHIAIIGLGGIGSEVAKTLTHYGVGKLTLVDDDVVELTNLPRIVGAGPSDACDGVLKIDVAARYARDIGSPTRVRCIAKRLDSEVMKDLAGCDLVISCVDRHTPRALLNRFAYHALVPVVDTGVALRIASDGTLAGDAGRIVVVGPGRPCLACWGHLDPDALRVEAYSEEERDALRREGYVAGAAIAQPAVMCFNGIVANWAVVEVLRLLAGFGRDEPVERLGVGFSSASVGRNRLAPDRRCSVCRLRTRRTW